MRGDVVNVSDEAVDNLAVALYKFMHDFSEGDWANHTVRHRIPLCERSEETRGRYNDIAKFVFDYLRTKGIDLEKLLNDDDVHCPFCDEGNFDKPGLKWHLGNCHKFIKTELI